MSTPPPPSKKRPTFLGEMLVDAGFITEKQLEIAISEQKRRGDRLGVILVESGFCTEQDVSSCIAGQLRLDLVRVQQRDIDLKLARRLDLEDMRAYHCVPVQGNAGRVRLAMADPYDVAAVNYVDSKLQMPVELVVATASDINDALDVLTDGIATVDEILAGADDGDVESLTDRVSVEKLVVNIIREAVKQGATDVHFEPDISVLRIRYRVDGIMIPGPMINSELSSPVVTRIKVISNLDISEHRLPQDGRTRLVIDETPYDLRVSVLPTVVGENVVLRILDSRTAFLDPRELGLAERNYDPVLDLTRVPHGIVLVTGPTGSGKSTTLYSLLRTVNALEKKVITVEDPVEYQVPFVRQVQVHGEIGLTFGAALRSILRQDPDVVLVGEVRDIETAEISIRAALTGHLVFSTLHTNTAIGAIPRFLDMGIDPFLLKSSLRGVMAQRLIRCICRECKTEYEPTDEEIQRFDVSFRESIDVLYRGEGCSRCGGSGYSGRTGIHELFLMSERIRKLDISRMAEGDIRVEAEKEGFRSLYFDGQEKVVSGVTTISEVARVRMQSS